jgi:hypothetical protein
LGAVRVAGLGSMTDSIISAIFLSVPLIFSGSVHMLIVSKNWLASWAVPISTTHFGVNKTWRGIVVMVFATVPGVYLAEALQVYAEPYLLLDFSGQNLFLLGVALGIGYVIPELPNSYIKRRLQIEPGERAKQHTFLFSFFDQVDSAIGCVLVYWLFLSPPLLFLVLLILLSPLIHFVINVSLFCFGLRKQPF